MLILGTNELIPLPTLPLWPEIPPFGIKLRRFGLTESDLAIDFSSTDRAALATSLLGLCTLGVESLPDDLYKDLSIGKRIEILLTLAFGGQDSRMLLLFKCSNCDEELEIELELAEISELQSASDELETIQVRLDESLVSFRKPTGRDQETWADTLLQGEADPLREMIDDLAVVPGLLNDLKPDAFLEMETALDEADPLVNFFCVVTCEVCGVQGHYHVDLLETALARLRSAQSELLLMVHRLASKYHWNEQEIFAIPHSRRLRYLQLIDEVVK